MNCFLRIAMCAAVLLAGCRRPVHDELRPWEENPGLDAHPTGQNLEGGEGTALPRVSFRFDPRREASAGAESEPLKEEWTLYRKAAESGQAWAQTKLGMAYVQQGDPRQLGEGLHWLRAAADQNDVDALRALSMLAAEGRGMEQSDKEAYKYMRRAADLDSPEAQYELANMLANGRGMARDMEAAIVWGRKAAERGYAPAQFSIGRILIESIEIERKEEGMQFLRHSIEGGNSTAAIFLATVLARGDFGVPKDELEAEAILKPFAEKGDAECQFALANLYGMAEAFKRNPELAMEWLERAAESGHEKAKAALAKIKASQPQQ